MLARLRENVARRKALAEKNRRKRGPAMRKSTGGETR
jgi:hypothetical protein